MKITDIKQQVKRQGRYSVYVDGAFSFGLSETALLDQGLRVGLELDAVRLKELQAAARADKALGRLMDLISRRPRSTWEARDYLRRKDYDEELIEQVVARVTRLGYLDDVVFARRWVENRRLLKPVSRQKLLYELRQKRVSDEAIEAALAEDVEENDERAILRTLVERKRRQYPDNQKMMQYLARQGYRYDDIKAVLFEADE